MLIIGFIHFTTKKQLEYNLYYVILYNLRSHRHSILCNFMTWSYRSFFPEYFIWTYGKREYRLKRTTQFPSFFRIIEQINGTFVILPSRGPFVSYTGTDRSLLILYVYHFISTDRSQWTHLSGPQKSKCPLPRFLLQCI